MKKNIHKKLVAGFGFCLLLIVSVVGFNYSSLRKLDRLYQETTRRSLHMELTTDAQHVGDELYVVIANAVINRNLSKSEQEWAISKKEKREKLLKVAEVAETPEEQANAREALQAINDIIRIYEQDLLPLILKGASVPGPISAVDEQIDRRIVVINLALQRVAQSMSEKNQLAGDEYNAILGQTRGFGFAISLAGVMAVLGISSFAARQIVGPLAEITGAALEVKRGNYLVGLKHQSEDEIGGLADAFRDMSKHVEKRTAELQISNERLQHEILERRQAEEEVIRLNAQLEQRVAERTAELVSANEQYQQVIIAQRATENELLSSREELRNLSAYQQSVREEDRKRISREIHDELGQGLTALKFDLAWLRKQFRKDQTALYEKAGSMKTLIESIVKTVQRISAELRPVMLDDLGLREAMEWALKDFRARTGITCAFNYRLTHFTENMESCTAIFRIFQEILTNVARHAQATNVSVLLEDNSDTLVLAIRDNGRGITGEEIADPKSLGLIGIRERARLCGGEARISGSLNEGTQVMVVIPQQRKEEQRC